jgi:hypothetical protein
MDTSELPAAFTRIAGTLGNVRSDSDESLGIVGYAVGALYGLRRAHALNYRDRTITVPRAARIAEATQVASELGSSDTISSEEWLAGWYFNSGLHHLDAATSRFNAMLKVAARKQRDAPVGTVARDVGHLKHRSVGLGEGRSVDMGEAIVELQGLAERLAIHFRKLANTPLQPTSGE